MAAIITEEFRRNNAQLLLNDIVTIPHYMGISQQTPWAENTEVPGAPYPKGTVGDTRRATHGLTGLFRVNSDNVNLVIPRNDLVANRTYKVYNPFDPTCFYASTTDNTFPCYITLDPNYLFLCIHKTSDADFMTDGQIAANLGDSGAGLNDYGGVVTFDGYTWAYLGRYDQYNFINSTEFVAFDNTITPTDQFNGDAETAAENATGGLVHGFTVLYGGDGYTQEASTEGTNISVNATIYGTDLNGDLKTDSISVLVDYENSKLKNVRLNTITSGIVDNYVEARIELTDWTLGNGYSDPTADAHIIVHVAPIDGFGADKASTLPAWYIGCYSDTGVAEYVPDTTTYHQISLIREPLQSGSETQLTTEYIQPLDYFELANWTSEEVTSVLPGWAIYQGNNKVGTLSHVQQVISSNDSTPLNPIRYYYYNDYYNGYLNIDPDDTGVIKFVSPDGNDEVDTNTAVTNVQLSDYQRHSGKLIFEDNRSTVTRQDGQSEELKVIIQL